MSWGSVWVVLLLCLGVWSGGRISVVWSQVAVGRFSALPPGDTLPAGWEVLTFPKIARQTAYRLVADGPDVVLQAQSQAAASGLRRAVLLDPRHYPIVQWRWKVTTTPHTSDVRRKDRDDAPARVYVAFAYDEARVPWFERAEFELVRSLYGQYPPVATLMYVWERQVPVGTLVTSPYTKRVKTFVLRNRADAQDTWYSEARNVVDDYQRAFGGAPPMIVGVGVMTDTDNTGATALSAYGDIVFHVAPH